MTLLEWSFVYEVRVDTAFNDIGRMKLEYEVRVDTAFNDIGRMKLWTFSKGRYNL